MNPLLFQEVLQIILDGPRYVTKICYSMLLNRPISPLQVLYGPRHATERCCQFYMCNDMCQCCWNLSWHGLPSSSFHTSPPPPSSIHRLTAPFSIKYMYLVPPSQHAFDSQYTPPLPLIFLAHVLNPKISTQMHNTHFYTH
jgi:hypothetical protein